MTTLSLYGYQEAAVASFEANVERHPRQVVKIPTGAGKTPIGLVAGRRRRESKKGRLLWLAHRKELVDQPLERLPYFWPGAKGGVVQDQRDERCAEDAVFASVQTAANRLKREWGPPFGLVVVDEVHHYCSPLWLSVLEHFVRRDSCPVLGLTATPTRHDGKNLRESGFTAFALRMSIAEAIRAGYLCPFRAVRVKLAEFDASKVPIRKDGEFDQKALATEAKRTHVAEETARAVVDHAPDRKSVVFACSVDVAKRTAEALGDLGFPARWLCDDTKDEERAATLAWLREGGPRAVVNVGVLLEGFDCPDIDCVVMAAPTRSRSRYIQAVGRGFRKHPGRDHLLILDLVPGLEIHGLQDAARLEFPETKEEREADVGGMDDLGEKERAPVDDGALVDRFLSASAQEAPPAREVLLPHWVSCAPGLYALPARDGDAYVIYEGPRGWTAELALGGKRGGVRLAGPAADISLVQSVAEQRARASGSLDLTAEQATWRSGDPDEDQLARLRELGGFWADGSTRGEVADLLAGAVVRRRYQAHLRRVANPT